MKNTRRRNQETDLPFVFVNFAMTADGKITTANRRVQAFSSPTDREHMFELRVGADAVMAGARTVDLNPVTLGPGGAKYRRQRERRGLAPYNLRIVVSGSGTVDPDSKLFTTSFSPIIVLTTQRAAPKLLEALRRRVKEVKVCGESEIDFVAALRWLRRQWNVRSLLCEGGGELSGALFRAGLVHELHLTICPKIFGGRDAPTLADGRGHLKLADATRLELTRSKRIDEELFLIYRVKNPERHA
jgi:2,5-diamino-6-(ribosylamino)-4(3H)-pyrimidinone 5'-phosphate reductase